MGLSKIKMDFYTQNYRFRWYFANLKQCTLLILLILWICPVGASEKKSPPFKKEYKSSLTLEDCLQLAADNHPELRVKNLEVKMAQEDVKIAQGAFMPTVFFSGSYFRINETPSIPIVNNSNLVTNVGNKNTFLVGATLVQPIYDPTLFALKTESHKQKNVADIKKTVAQKESLKNVQKVFFKGLFYKEMITLNKEFHHTVSEKVSKTEQQFSRGGASGLEKAKAEGTEAMSQSTYNQALAGYEASKDELKRMIGYPLDQDIILEGTLEDYVRQRSGSPESRPAGGSDNDPEVRLAQANYDLAHAEKKRVLSQFYPKLYTSFNLYGTYPDLIVEPDNKFQLHYLATAHLEFPIFDGLRQLHAYHKAALQEQMALIGKEEAMRNVEMKERARERFDSTEIIPLKGPKKTLEEARKTYEVAAVAKRTGFISAGEYMGAEKYWAKTRLDYAKAQLEWLIEQLDRE